MDNTSRDAANLGLEGVFEKEKGVDLGKGVLFGDFEVDMHSLTVEDKSLCEVPIHIVNLTSMDSVGNVVGEGSTLNIQSVS